MRALGATVAVMGGSALAVSAYLHVLRPWILHRGATPAEVAATLPGDELLDDADGVATRAITIHAGPEHVYPWLAQMGPAPRGGAYTYDWIDNLLGLDMHSADHVLPQFQQTQVGEEIALGPNVRRVEIADPGHDFVTRSADGSWVWASHLEPVAGSTRLISRNRFRVDSLPARLGMLPLEPASLVMEQKMLRGIRDRAQHLARSA